MLLSTRQSVLKQLADIDKPHTLSGADFELIVYENIVVNALNTPFENTLRHTEDREFPDIVAAGLYGIEVKATKKNDWTSIGNSVLESSRVNGIEKIYMFFGKLGGTPDIKYRQYEDCLKGIAVTHYPRYQIDMLLNESESIFEKMGVEYETIRKSNNPVKAIRKYYKSQMKEGDALWWVDDDPEQASSLSPIIKNFSSLDANIRDQIKAEIFVFFPEILSTSSKKYEKIPAFLASQYGVVTANLRDNFTAGGQVPLNYSGEIFKVSQITSELLRLAPIIHDVVNDTKISQLANRWQKNIDETHSSSYEIWLREIDRQTTDSNLPYKISELFKRSLDESS